MDPDLRDRLEAIVRASNALRSAAAAAVGFTSGRRIEAKRAAAIDKARAFAACDEWIEDQARAALGLPPRPGRD